MTLDPHPTPEPAPERTHRPWTRRQRLAALAAQADLELAAMAERLNARRSLVLAGGAW